MNTLNWHWTKRAAHGAVRRKIWHPAASAGKTIVTSHKRLPHTEKMAAKVAARAELAKVWNQGERARTALETFSSYWQHVRRLHGVGSRALREARQSRMQEAA